MGGIRSPAPPDQTHQDRRVRGPTERFLVVDAPPDGSSSPPRRGLSDHPPCLWSSPVSFWTATGPLRHTPGSGEEVYLRPHPSFAPDPGGSGRRSNAPQRDFGEGRDPDPDRSPFTLLGPSEREGVSGPDTLLQRSGFHETFPHIGGTLQNRLRSTGASPGKRPRSDTDLDWPLRLTTRNDDTFTSTSPPLQ